MARIKIEDLPAAENLTPEEEALVEGAGLPSFRPTLEGLEDRQLLASHLAAALPVQPPALGGSVGQALSAPQVEVHTGLMASAAPQGAAVSSQQPAGALAVSQAEDPQRVANFITDQVRGKFNEILGANRFQNAWQLQDVTGANGTFLASGARIRVQVNFNYGVAWDIKGNAVLEFRKEGMVGGREGWTFDRVEGIDWKGWARQDFREGITELYRGWRVGGQALYGEKELGENVARELENSWKSVTGMAGNFPLKRVVGMDGGGLRVELSNNLANNPRAGYVIELQCDGFDATSGSYRFHVTRAEIGAWDTGGKWEGQDIRWGGGNWYHQWRDAIDSCTFSAQALSAPRATAAPPSGIAAGHGGTNEGSQPSPVLALQQHKDNPTLSQAQADTAADAFFASLKENERP